MSCASNAIDCVCVCVFSGAFASGESQCRGSYARPWSLLGSPQTNCQAGPLRKRSHTNGSWKSDNLIGFILFPLLCGREHYFALGSVAADATSLFGRVRSKRQSKYVRRTRKKMPMEHTMRAPHWNQVKFEQLVFVN